MSVETARSYLHSPFLIWMHSTSTIRKNIHSPIPPLQRERHWRINTEASPRASITSWSNIILPAERGTGGECWRWGAAQAFSSDGLPKLERTVLASSSMRGQSSTAGHSIISKSNR